MSSNASGSSSSTRNGYIFPNLPLRRLFLQPRAGRSSYTARMCDVERGSSTSATVSNSKSSNGRNDMSTASSSTAGGDTSSNRTNESTTQSMRSHTTSPHQQNVSNQRASLQKGTGNGASSTNLASANGSGGNSSNVNNNSRSNRNSQECPLCYAPDTPQGFYTMSNCKHYACRICLESYLHIEIFESRTEIACTQCADSMHPSDIESLLQSAPAVLRKYEDFMVRRVLLADPDSRWCPGPDCGYAVIASGCASCPRIKCERPGCDVNFCYHCKAEWHPDQTCDAARASRQSPMRAASGSISQDSQHRTDDIKPCPRCQVLIVKMDDGSCNHMVCAVCGSEFCWLCMKEISDLHYLSPSGCTFWGKKPWSRKKKLLWQLGTLVGAPVGIALVAGIAVPAMIIGIPVWIGRKLHTRYRLSSKHKRNFAVLGGVAASVLVSPVLAGLAVAIGVPILLFYVYGVVPVSLCRAGCAVSTTRDGFKFDFDEEDNSSRNNDNDAISRIGATSIGEVSLSVVSGSHLGASSHNNAFTLTQSNGSRGSMTALSGSITGNKMEVQADISTSETASAVTCVSEKSNNTQNDNASTRALAGSMCRQAMDSSNVSEDGASERVRFDNNLYFSVNSKDSIEKDGCSVDKASMSSDRSFKICGADEMDAASISSFPKRNRLSQLITQQQRSTGHGSALNIPEVDQLISKDNATSDSTSQTVDITSNDTTSKAFKDILGPQTKSSLNIASKPLMSQTPNSRQTINTTDNNQADMATAHTKNISNAAVLRRIFFSQISNGNNTASSNANATYMQASSPTSTTANKAPSIESIKSTVPYATDENSAVLLTTTVPPDPKNSTSATLPIQSDSDK